MTPSYQRKNIIIEYNPSSHSNPPQKRADMPVVCCVVTLPLWPLEYAVCIVCAWTVSNWLEFECVPSGYASSMRGVGMHAVVCVCVCVCVS